jgi:uncharacterized protein YigE (DUF2233 family)
VRAYFGKSGTQVAKSGSVKSIYSFVLIALAAISVSAQEFGSEYRKEYEKEKNGPHGECRTDWERLRKGLEYRAIHCLGDEDDLDVHVIRIDLDEWDLNTSVVRGSTARGIARQKSSPFVINANFFDKARNPLGVIVSSGEVVSTPRDSSWQSIFLITKKGNPYVIMPEKWPVYRDLASMAVQAGPRLVINGRTNRSLSNNYAAERAGVCVQWDKDLLFFAMPKNRKMHIKEMAKVTRRAEIDGGLACKEAMLFDGGHSVNLLVEGGDERHSIEGDPVPVFVFAKRK